VRFNECQRRLGAGLCAARFHPQILDIEEVTGMDNIPPSISSAGGLMSIPIRDGLGKDGQGRLPELSEPDDQIDLLVTHELFSCYRVRVTPQLCGSIPDFVAAGEHLHPPSTYSAEEGL
jgi:hypothetical protein